MANVSLGALDPVLSVQTVTVVMCGKADYTNQHCILWTRMFLMSGAE